MRIVIAPDYFKECLSAPEVAASLRKGVLAVFPKADVVNMPMADGGEGTLDILVQATGGRKISVQVHDPLNRTMEAQYGILGDEETVVVELASASGIQLLQPHERNPLFTTTYGTGELIKHAVEQGYRKFILGLGGSATNDGGAGLLQALGMRLTSSDGKGVKYGGEILRSIREVSMDEWLPDLRLCQFTVACDVCNPLCGPNGASYIFGAQKGATPEMLPVLDTALKHFSRLLSVYFGVDWSTTPGAGAAGGVAFSLLSCLRAKIVPGFGLIAGYTHLEDYIREADWVMTGEGKVDRQTLSGKVPMGVTELAAAYKVPVVVFCGQMGEGAELLYEKGVRAIIQISEPGTDIAVSIAQAPKLLAQSAEKFMKILHAKMNPEE